MAPVTIPKLGQTRCYWTLLNANLQFLFLDPVLGNHMGEQAQALIGHNLLEFVHPDEQASANVDLHQVLENKALHGSVTRVKYVRASQIKVMLGAPIRESFPHAELVGFDQNYLPCDIVINWVADNLVLCFIHAIIDVSPKHDNDELFKSHWTNWCGTIPLETAQVEVLYDRLLRASTAFPLLAASPQFNPPRPDENVYPHRIFQILLNQPARRLVFFWPNRGYYPRDYSQLALDVRMESGSDKGSAPGSANGEDGTSSATSSTNQDATVFEARTSCTRRYQCQQTIVTDDNKIREVESIYIPHGSVIFACHMVLSESTNEPTFSQRLSMGAYNSRISAAHHPVESLGYSPYAHQTQPQPFYGDQPSSVAGYPYGEPTQSEPHSTIEAWNSTANAYAPDSQGSVHAPHSTADITNLRDVNTTWAQSLLGEYPQPSTHSHIVSNVSNGFAQYQSLIPPNQEYPLSIPNTTSQEHRIAAHHHVYFGYQDPPQQPSPPQTNPYIQSQSQPQDPGPSSQPAPPPPIHQQSLEVPQQKEHRQIQSQPRSHPFQRVDRPPSPLRRALSPTLPSLTDSMVAHNIDTTNANGMEKDTSKVNGRNDSGKAASVSSRPSVNPPSGVLKCAHCGTVNAPEWRKGPSGLKDLCNACGLRYSRSRQKQEGFISTRRRNKDKDKDKDKKDKEPGTGNGSVAQKAVRAFQMEPSSTSATLRAGNERKRARLDNGNAPLPSITVEMHLSNTNTVNAAGFSSMDDASSSSSSSTIPLPNVGQDHHSMLYMDHTSPSTTLNNTASQPSTPTFYRHQPPKNMPLPLNSHEHEHLYGGGNAELSFPDHRGS